VGTKNLILKSLYDNPKYTFGLGAAGKIRCINVFDNNNSKLYKRIIRKYKVNNNQIVQIIDTSK